MNSPGWKIIKDSLDKAFKLAIELDDDERMRVGNGDANATVRGECPTAVPQHSRPSFLESTVPSAGWTDDPETRTINKEQLKGVDIAIKTNGEKGKKSRCRRR